MTDVAIQVENLSKLYHIGRLQQRHDTLRDAIVDGFKSLRRRNGAAADESIWALKDVSFEVKQGEVLGVIGRNGAGKSTLLKVLSRITEPTGGRAVINGRVGSLLEVGTGFHPELTGRENIYLNGAILGMRRSEIERKFDEIVAFAEIEKFLDTPVKRYSSGMYVRLAFAVAAHLEPEILLVDEVLAVGDIDFQKKCLGKMGEVARKGRTVLFVSHNLSAVRALCTRCILIHSGAIARSGATNEVLEYYMNLGHEASFSSRVEFSKPKDLCLWVNSAFIKANDVLTARMRMGDSLTLGVLFRSEKPILKPSVGFVISSMNGDQIINANNIYQEYAPYPDPKTEGTIICKLGKVPLMANRYAVSFWLGEDSSREYQYLENALQFEVTEFDTWGKGKLPTRNITSLWWPTQFDLL